MPGMAGPAVLDDADQLLHHGSLSGLVVRPQPVEAPLPRFVGGQVAEQEEQPTVGAPERVALEVEEDVGRVGLRKLLEAVAPDRIVVRLDQDERRLLVRMLAGLHLQLGLHP